MDIEQLKATIQRELPQLLQQDSAFRHLIWDLVHQDFPSRAETDSRFDRVLAELKRDREEQTRKWDEQTRKWDEQTRKWDANQAELRRMNDALLAIAHKHERSIGALGSRWGLQSEKAFRDALAAILERSFGVQVLNINDYDESGEVFGHPDQVELDVLIKNGWLIICELKSSIDKAGMHIFERKARFYEKRHGRKANRLMVISPMIDTRARKVGEQLGIEMYGDSQDAPVDFPSSS